MIDITSRPSPNWDNRKDGQSPSFIIIHYTGTKTADEAAERFIDEAPSDAIGRISPHYMIDGKGQIIKFVDEDKRAWHAGTSQWKDVTDLNSASIGIEIWNTGHEFECEPYIPEQIDALIDLITDIKTRWDIPDQNILGHSDIAPGRKMDPGEHFPWRKLEVNGIGLLPQIWDEKDDENGHHVEEMKASPSTFFEALKEFGYTYPASNEVLLKEFCRHYMPEKLGATEPDTEICSALASLIHQVR